MKTEQILTKVIEILKNGCNRSDVENLADVLKSEIMNETAKADGRLSAKRAADRIIKTFRERRPEWGAFDFENKQYIGGMYSFIALNDPLPVEQMGKNEDFHDDFYARFWNDTQKYEYKSVDFDFSDFKKWVKIQKAERKARKDKSCIFYDFGENLPQVNADFLTDIVAILGADVRVRVARPLDPILFESEKGEGYLLPVRKER